VIVGIFARADHPEGWGFPIRKPDGTIASGTAHGYVVIFVRCPDEDTLGHVVNRLVQRPFYGDERSDQYNAGNLHGWFGGRFDYIATCPDVAVPMGPFACRGDNRMVAVYDAEDVLDAL
jgi:hypothetical protein